jgi:hypothetical protein
MPICRDQFKSSYGAFSARERDLARSRALRDAREAADERAAGSPPTRQARGVRGAVGGGGDADGARARG